MQKKINLFLFTILITFLSFNSSFAKEKEILMATTTSAADTGLLDYLIPIFHAETGFTLKYLAVGTGEAIALGKNGDVSIVLVHAKDKEEDFVKQGFGLKRFPFMYNDFILVGPKNIEVKNNSVYEIFNTILQEKLPFISRGDNSGTHEKEKSIWEKLGIKPNQNPNYLESGQGMGATISLAEEKKAYTLTDRGTWLKISKDSDIETENIVVFEGDKTLFNQYSVIAINPEKFPETNSKGANTFIQWLLSAKALSLINNFGIDKFGQALFITNSDL